MERARSSGLNQGDDVKMITPGLIKRILVVLLFCAGFVPVCSAGAARSKAKPQRISVSELLDRFAEKRNRFPAIIVEAEIESRNTTRFEKVQYRVDKTRGSIRWYSWGNLGHFYPNVSRGEAHYYSKLWDGQNYYTYNQVPPDLGLVIIYREEDLTEKQNSLKNVGKDSCTIMGYHKGDGGKRIDEILGRANRLSLRRNMKTTIYYFTGTDNSLKIAKSLSDKLKECELIPIAKVWEEDNLASTSE